jgi:Cyclin, N-terminal domain
MPENPQRRGPRHPSTANTSEEDPWLFTAEELLDTPSRLAGVSAALEDRAHVRSARYIAECALELRIPQLTILVAATFLRRFYMLEALTDHETPAVAAACLFLACKVQETHKRLRDFVYWTVKIRTRGLPGLPEGMDLYEDNPLFEREKAAMLAKEADVLRVLNFDLTIDQPYKHLLVMGREMLQLHLDAPDGESAQLLRQRNKEVMQHAWNFINDSSGSYVHVRFDAREIATAALFVAARLHKMELPTAASGESEKPSWHEYFGCNLENVEEICNAMLDMYDPEKDPVA